MRNKYCLLTRTASIFLLKYINGVLLLKGGRNKKNTKGEMQHKELKREKNHAKQLIKKNYNTTRTSGETKKRSKVKN